MRRLPRLPRPTGTVALLALLALPALSTACGSVESTAVAVVQYDFDDGLLDGGGGRLIVADASGHERAATVEAANGGEALLETVGRGDGQALRFPGPCSESDPALCPRAIMVAEGVSGENPRELDFAISVDILIGEDDVTGSDQNVMQKGNFDDVAQWKIEVGSSGLARCVFRYASSVEDDNAHILAWDDPVVDGDWHTVRCARSGDNLSITVDGESESTAIPAQPAADFFNDRPLILGGRDTGAANDQFHGALDNAAFEIAVPEG